METSTVLYSDSEAFSVKEYNRHIPKRAIKNDLESYLGEYRYNIFRRDYELLYSDGHICDVDQSEPMIYKAQRALEKRIQSNKPIHREEAEYKGIAYLDRTLQDAQVGDVILWMSPPGPKEENYGEYGFAYKGVILGSADNEKNIKMTAFRIEKNDLTTYKEIMSEVIGFPLYFRNADDFLSNPVVVHSETKSLEAALLGRFGEQSENDNKFRFSMQTLEPLIREFTEAVKLGLPKNELRRIFYSIENLAIHIKEKTLPMDYGSLTHAMLIDPKAIVNKYGSHRAPFVGGSCGGTDKKKTNILDPHNFIKQLLGEDNSDFEPFHCPNPKCGVVIYERVQGNNCPECGFSKKDFIAIGGETC